LLFNTNHQGRDGNHTNILYIPIAPEYLPTQTKDPYHNNNQLIEQNRQIKGVDLEHLMLKRGEIMDSKLQMLLSEIYCRHIIKKENLYDISIDQCTCRNLIYFIGNDCLDTKRIELERKIIDLEQEKRKEKAGYFNDILFLKKELRETLIEKLEEEQKAMILNKPEEEPR